MLLWSVIYPEWLAWSFWLLAMTKILHRGINLYLVSYGQTYPGIPKFEGGFSGVGERANAKVNLEFEIETL